MGLLQLLPLVLLLAFLCVFAWVGYQMYLYTNQLSDRGLAHMQKKHNISYTKDGGMKVGVKEKSDEEYSSGIQKNLVSAWNESRWPAYKSMFWNKDASADANAKASTPSSSRPSGSRSTSSASKSGSASTKPPTSRSVSGAGSAAR